jgi:hypothetical protein
MRFVVKFGKQGDVKEAPPASEFHPTIIYTQKWVFLQGIFAHDCLFPLIPARY